MNFATSIILKLNNNSKSYKKDIVEAELEEYLTITSLTYEEWPYWLNSSVWTGDTGRVPGLSWVYQLSSYNPWSSAEKNIFLFQLFFLWGKKSHIWKLEDLFNSSLSKYTHFHRLYTLLCLFIEGGFLIFLYFPILFPSHLSFNCERLNYIKIYTSISIN